jgi:hypothetical protein
VIRNREDDSHSFVIGCLMFNFFRHSVGAEGI